MCKTHTTQSKKMLPLELRPNQPNPLLQQGVFISSISHKNPLFSRQYLAHLPSTQPDNRPNEALSAQPKKTRAYQINPQYFSPYFYSYFLKITAKYSAPYRHHGYHWLV